MRPIALLLLLTIAAHCADVLPASRRANWNLAGVPGGIIPRTTIFTTFTSTATSANIEGACNSCPSNQVVSLGPGTYTIAGDIQCVQDYFTLRGTTNANGIPTTVLRLTSGSYGQGGLVAYGGIYPQVNNFSACTVRNVTSGYTHGSSNIVVDSTPTGLLVDHLFCIDEITNSVNGKYGGFLLRRDAAVTQIKRVTAVSGTTISFWPPLVGDFWTSGADPEIYYWGAGAARYVGFEDLIIEPESAGTAGQGNVVFLPAYACWAKNVWTTKWTASGGSSGFRFFWGLQCEMRDCVTYDAQAVASSAYGTYSVIVGYNLYINNLSTNVALVHPMICADTCVMAYNVSLPPLPYSPNSWLPEQNFTHGGFPTFNLWEGVWGQNIFFDKVSGANTAWNVINRCRLEGWYTGKTGDTTPIIIENNSPNCTIVGNVLGWDGYHTQYKSTTSQQAGWIYNIEALATNTFITNNYNTLNDGVNSAEAIGGNTQVNSYFLSGDGASKPSFWGLYQQWPPITPAAVETNALWFTNWPAGYRAQYGAWPAIGTSPPPSGPDSVAAPRRVTGNRGGSGL